MPFSAAGDDRFYPPPNFAALEQEFSAFEAARVVILPVPYDSTVSGRVGAREGPRAIIDASGEMETFDLALGFEPFRHGIHTLPELAPETGSSEGMVRRVESVVRELLDAGKFVVTLGGEHTVAVGAARAHAARTPGLSVLAIDAHADLRDAYLDSPYNHACTLRRILESAPVVQVGLRSAAVEEAALIQERALPWLTPAVYRREGPAGVAKRLASNVYVTIDLDGFDPSIMAAVGTPEPGGLLWDEVTALLAAVARDRRVVGFDVTELAPALGPPACAQAAAKLTYRLIGLALGRPDNAT